MLIRLYQMFNKNSSTSGLISIISKYCICFTSRSQRISFIIRSSYNINSLLEAVLIGKCTSWDHSIISQKEDIAALQQTLGDTVYSLLVLKQVHLADYIVVNSVTKTDYLVSGLFLLSFLYIIVLHKYFPKEK